MWFCDFTPCFFQARCWHKHRGNFAFYLDFGQTGLLLGSVNHSKDTKIGYDGIGPLTVPSSRYQDTLILLELLLWILFCTKLICNPSGMWRCVGVVPGVSEWSYCQLKLSGLSSKTKTLWSFETSGVIHIAEVSHRSFNFWLPFKVATFRAIVVIFILTFSRILVHTFIFHPAFCTWPLGYKRSVNPLMSSQSGPSKTYFRLWRRRDVPLNRYVASCVTPKSTIFNLLYTEESSLRSW